jgi:hypothetical protein
MVVKRKEGKYEYYPHCLLLVERTTFKKHISTLYSLFFICFRFIIDEQTGRLTINDAKRTDEGEIKCLVENRAGKIEKTAYLKVRRTKSPFYSPPRHT